MGRQRSPNRDRAYEMWKESNGTKPLKSIAEELGEPETLVRKWKCQDKWDSKSNVTEKKKGNVTKRKRGAPKGNHNAKGHGAPKGNTNSLKHGGYSMRMYGEGLSEEEQELWDSMDEDEEELLLEQIRFYRLRERRILIAIASLQEEHQLITGVMQVENKRNFKNASEMERYNEQIEEKVAKGERLAGDAFQMQTMTENSYKRIERLEAELTKVQRAKVEAIGKLADIRKNRNEATGDEAVDDWIKAIMDGDSIE